MSNVLTIFVTIGKIKTIKTNNKDNRFALLHALVLPLNLLELIKIWKKNVTISQK